MLRELVSRFSSTIAERRASVRKKLSVPVKVCFSPEKGGLRSSCDDLFLSGETADISATGIGFEVSSIRIKEKYLVGQDRLLNVELDFAGTKVRMQVRGCRYEKVGIHLSTEKYLVGAVIVNVTDEDKSVYEHILANGYKSSGKMSAVLELGTK
jgi:PilZ domain-containing protein